MTHSTAPASATKPRPDLRFMLRHPAHILAQGFGSGLSSVVPGTMGTLFAWLSFHWLSGYWPQCYHLNNWIVIIIAGFEVGIWACDVTGKHLGKPDDGSMVWDEIIAFWLVLIFVTPSDTQMQTAAFLIFRFFDMVKPPPIRYFDQKWKGGFGVMADDIIAAFFTLLSLAIWKVL